MTTNTNDTDFFAPLIEQLVATVDEQTDVNHSNNSAYQYVEGLFMNHPEYTAGDWFIQAAIESQIAQFLGYAAEGDDVDNLLEAMGDLAANAND